MLNLYRSEKFYSDKIVGLAIPTMQSLFGDGLDQGVIDLTDVDDLEQAIKDIEPPKKNVVEENILDMPYVEYSLLENSPDDAVIVYFDIESIKHVEDIPKINEIRDVLEYRARVFMAEAEVADTITHMIMDDIGNLDSGVPHDHDGDGIPDH